MKIASIVGARPNLMKIAPLVRELRRIPAAHHLLVHTGQHYDDQLSAVFFRDLGLPEPDINLQVGSGSHTWQTAEIMQRLEPVLRDWNPDLVIVVGDVNSTLAAALTAAKLGLRIAHVEAGLRSFDPRMPEEINRKLTDAIANFLFVTEESGIRNLRNEGISSERIFLVGNVMIDSLLHHRNLAARSNILKQLSLATDGSDPHPYAVLTLHRPSNVDDAKVLQNILETVATIAQDLPVYFPIHPRTKARINTLGYDHYFASDHNKPAPRGLLPLDPLGYLDFLCLMDHARLVLTDSGGIQEETTVLGTPCLTLRETTERPVTIEQGTNRLVGLNPKNILDVARHVLTANNLKGGRPPLWDGHAAKRIVKIILERLRTEQSDLCSQSETSFSSASS